MIKLLSTAFIVSALVHVPMGTYADAASAVVAVTPSGSGLKSLATMSPSSDPSEDESLSTATDSTNQETSQNPDSSSPASPTPEAVDMAQLWQDVNDYIEEVEFKPALESLDLIRQNAQQHHDDDNLTKALLTSVRLHIQNGHDYESSLDLLYQSPMPADDDLRAMLIMVRAYCLRHYFQANAYVIAQNPATADFKDFRSWTTTRFIEACQKDFEQAWQHRGNFGRETYDPYVPYFEYWNVVFGSNPTIRDYLTYAMAEFLADPATWSPKAYEGTKRLNSRGMKTEPFKYVADVDLSTTSANHPIEKLIFVFKDLTNWYEQSSALNKAIYARQQCSTLVKRAFSKYRMAAQSLENMNNAFNAMPTLPSDLETLKTNFKKRVSW